MIHLQKTERQEVCSKKTTANCNVIRVCSTNKIKCLNTEFLLQREQASKLIDNGSSISFLSWSTDKELWKSENVRKYTKRWLTGKNSTVKIIRRVILLVQLQPRLTGVEQEFVITAHDVIKSLVGIDFMKTNKRVLNWHEPKWYIVVKLKFNIAYNRENASC